MLVLRVVVVVVVVGMMCRVCGVIVLARLPSHLLLLWFCGLSVKKARREQEPSSKRCRDGRGLCDEVGRK